ncbi:MAG: glycosyltransferase family 1 protein [Chloroflexi bacterium]|nr:glycosyltransferase family 1 protein [Chloroflexota bacterium]
MLRGRGILCFAPDPWEALWRNRHQLLSVLAEQNQVIYVEPRPYLRSVVQQVRSGQLFHGRRAPRLVTVQAGLHVYRPPLYAPLTGREPLRLLTDALRKASLCRAMRQVGMDRPILWLFRPDMDDVPGRYGECLLIYHIVDEYTGYADVDPARVDEIRRRERALIARADLVLVTSRGLLESKGGTNPNTHWVPNGVDYERFAAAAREQVDPPELLGVPRPRIGYVGALNDKIDTGLLLQVADAYPQAALVLVGPVQMLAADARREMDALRERPNVRVVGQVPGQRVAEFTAACDVGLLPYRQNAWTQNIHPLKMYEYLACGLPVVATDIPAVREEQAVIRIVGDGAAFVDAIGAALAEQDEALRTERQARAARNTWRDRVERISALIEATLRKRGVA